MDLFNQNLPDSQPKEPLAARMRPRTLEEFIGQESILGEGRLLRRAIQADRLSSLIFYGPPGTGKTTLARVIANTTKAHFIAINAVLSGVKDIREAIATAKQRRDRHSQRTILFVDEVHRFNKSQQDALLPWVENGTVILIGATTENPFFEVNKALVSRSRIFQLQSLSEAHLYKVLEQTLNDRDRGYGTLSIHIEPEAIGHLIQVANGDARSLLNALELAVETTPPTDAGTICITLDVAEQSIQQRAVLYDKEGDAHFDTISAFIKSMRGSDADAALYWLAKMVYAGEDPRFIFRRLLILASEDVGLADPEAVVVVNACAAAFDRVGMPEGRYHLAQATLYLATAPKSNSAMGFFDALAAVEKERETQVPTHLKDASRDKKGFGHGAGYLYPHAYRDHWVAQQYLPANLQGQLFYQPSSQGREGEIAVRVKRRREAQLAAFASGAGEVPAEILTYSPSDRSADRWLQRTLGQMGDAMERLRDRLFELAQPQRHHLILDLHAKTGLLTWEAIRRVPEGGVYAVCRSATEAKDLAQQAIALPELMRPQVLHSSLSQLPNRLAKNAPPMKFDRIIGRNAILHEADKPAIALCLTQLLPQGGRLILAETVPQQTQRLYRFLDRSRLQAGLYDRLVAAEEAIYEDKSDPMVNWQAEDLQAAFQQAGFRVELYQERSLVQMAVTPTVLDRWFTPATRGRSSYVTRLAQMLSPAEVRTVEAAFRRELGNGTVPWETAIAFVVCY
ncbi:AAA family ATPase [Phormidium sp. CCY1219]|uniref:AAA family ATPase n=1 Tax=Phormidium sp. CCY1219 TaxID=2886104 RepID=UPI002D1F98D3|nr:AAA family ATPase [Phormidium sp. CCY1219]MEB3830988.1 AAA family ATPase [Phormidium sp. CCY1219]